MNVIQAYYDARFNKFDHEKCNKHLIEFNHSKKLPKEIATLIEKVNVLFSYLILDRKPELMTHMPYVVFVSELKPKNKYTKGVYAAVNRDNGMLDLFLNYKKIKNAEKPLNYIFNLTWVMFHELRHKIQLKDDLIKSVINYPNWSNFNKWMQESSSKSEDEIDHIFHELNPAEVDANIFACEMTGIKFNGNAFDITEESLRALINDTM